jgi:hypothetical protein
VPRTGCRHGGQLRPATRAGGEQYGVEHWHGAV